jgi:monoamine oxidase
MKGKDMMHSLHLPIRRRAFIKRSGLLAAGTLLAPGSVVKAWTQSVPRPDRQYDVVIIGAGLSGLVAARKLRQLGIDNIKVIEGRGRVGGRTIDREMVGGGHSEDGGVWVGPTQDAILELMDELGVEKFRTYVEGNRIFDTSIEIGPREYIDYERAVRLLDDLA